MLRHINALMLASLVFGVFLVALFFLTNAVLPAIVHNYGIVVVPDLSRTEVNQARGMLHNLSLNLDVSDFEHHELPEGRIISQIPTQGRQVYKNRTIQVIVSRGPKLVTVPTLAGLSFHNVNDIFRTHELKVGNIVQHYSNDVPAGLIINTTPAAGVTIMAGSPVNLIISIGRDPLDAREPVEDNLFDFFFFNEGIF